MWFIHDGHLGLFHILDIGNSTLSMGRQLYLFFACVSVCAVCICVSKCVCVYVCACIYMFMHMWRTKVEVVYPSWLLFILIHWDRVSSWTCWFNFWLGSCPQGSPVSTACTLGLSSHHASLDFMDCKDSYSGPHLDWQVLYLLSHLTSLGVSYVNWVHFLLRWTQKWDRWVIQQLYFRFWGHPTVLHSVCINLHFYQQNILFQSLEREEHIGLFGSGVCELANQL